MITIVDKEKCSGCYACEQICPKQCVKMVVDNEGFWYPEIDLTKCVNCGACEKVCSIKNLKPSQKNENLVAYAVKNIDDEVRLKSSSGGVFFALATYVLGQGGIVFGASFDADFNVVHKYVDRIEDLDALCGSKYVQSCIGNAYKDVESFLNVGKIVLFTGTPCQVEGLLSYLKKPYDNLLTQDLICHGVPSPMVWQKYLGYRKNLAKSEKIQEIAFRSKNEGWKRYSVSFIFDNNTEYRCTLDKDPMMQVFLNNLCLRPSCYNCNFKKKNRNSDITLADFWGINNVLPDMDDDKGTSLVIIHSLKGKKMFEQIKDNLIRVETDIDTAISFNSSMIKSVDMPRRRQAFLREISSNNFGEIQKKYCKITVGTKIKKIVNKVFKKIKKIIKK